MKRLLLAAALALLYCLPVFAQPNHFDVAQAIAAKYGLPPNDNDEARRAWTDKVAETLAAKHPLEGWGRKSSSPTSPRSADVVCTRSPFLGVDLLNGSTGQLQWAGGLDLTGQNYIAVTPKDWLAADPPPGPPPVDPPGEESLPAILRRIDDRLAALEAAVKGLAPPAVLPSFDLSLRLPYGLGTATGTATPRR
jgi:hypothetical protein